MLYLIFSGLVLLVALDLYTLIRKYIPLEHENAGLNRRVNRIEDDLVKGLATHGNRLAVRVEALENAWPGQRKANVEFSDGVFNARKDMEDLRKVILQSLSEMAHSAKSDYNELGEAMTAINKKLAKSKTKKLTKGRVSKK